MLTIEIPARELRASAVLVFGGRNAVSIQDTDTNGTTTYAKASTGTVYTFHEAQTVSVLVDPATAAYMGMVRDTALPERVLSAGLPARDRVRRVLDDYYAALDAGRHADIARACLTFTRWASCLRAQGVRCEPDGYGVRWSVTQTAALLLREQG